MNCFFFLFFVEYCCNLFCVLACLQNKLIFLIREWIKGSQKRVHIYTKTHTKLREGVREKKHNFCTRKYILRAQTRLQKKTRIKIDVQHFASWNANHIVFNLGLSLSLLFIATIVLIYNYRILYILFLFKKNCKRKWMFIPFVFYLPLL
jgi:hypothetical protein